MAVKISEGVRKLLEAPSLASLATLMPDGAPQVTPVWVDFDGTHILVNTAEVTREARNVRRDSRVAISVVDQQKPYSYVTVRGRVVDITPDGAEEHVDRMAMKYMGRDTFPLRAAGVRRIIFKIEPQHVSTMMVD